MQGLTRDLKTPLVVADAIVSSIDGAQSPELKMLLASLLDERRSRRWRAAAALVRIWTKAQRVRPPSLEWTEEKTGSVTER